MTKKLIVLGVIFAFVMTLSVSAIAANQKATLINSLGDKVVVAVNSAEAQYWFGKGFSLIRKVLGAFSGPDIYMDLRVHGKVDTGGKTLVATSSMNTAFSLTAAQVCNNSTIAVNTAADASFLAAASLDIN